MSTPHEASLTEKERAILARLAAQAEADDPSLAATLRGRARRAAKGPRLAQRIGVPQIRVPRAVSHWRWGVVLAVIGLVMMVASLAVSVVLGIAGAALTFAGIYRAIIAHPGAPTSGGTCEATQATSDN